jgi:hypothetical protein
VQFPNVPRVTSLALLHEAGNCKALFFLNEPGYVTIQIDGTP